METAEILSFPVNTISNQVTAVSAVNLRLLLPLRCALSRVVMSNLSDVLTFESEMRTPKHCVEASADDSSVGGYLLP